MRGFFLIELLASVALIGVLVGLVLPGMQQLLRVHQVRTVARDLSSEIFWAQAEAARRGSALVLRLKNVSECRSAPAGTPLRCGWDVFMDLNQDGLQQAGEMIVHSYENPADLTIRPTSGDTVFIDPAGIVRNKIGGGSIGVSFLVEAVRARPGDPASLRVCINSGSKVRVALQHIDALAENMRLNVSAAKAGLYAMAWNAPRPPTTDCRLLACSPAQLADHDLDLWVRSLQAALPLARGMVTAVPASTQIAIAVAWPANERAMTAIDAALQAALTEVTATATGIDCPAGFICHVGHVLP